MRSRQTDGDEAGLDSGEIQLINRMAPFTGAAVSTAAGSARREALEMSQGDQRLFEIEVLPGAEALIVELRGLADGEADFDLNLFDCTDAEEGCEAARVDADPTGDERILVINPEPGSWKVVVDAFSAPESGASLEYFDAVLAPSYGAVVTADMPQARAHGDRWLAGFGTWLDQGLPGSGRVPWAALIVSGEVHGTPVPLGVVGLPGW